MRAAESEELLDLAVEGVAHLFGSSGKWQLGLPSITLREPVVAPGERSHRVTLLNEVGHPIRVEVVLAGAAGAAEN